MNKKLLIICIIVFLTKTGNVFSSNSIFDVNNIIITNYNYQNKEKLLDRAFKDGFYKLTEKILQKKDSDSLKKIGLKEIRQLISSYQIIENKDFNKKNEVKINLSFSRSKINNLFYKNNISYADVSKTDLVIFPVLIDACICVIRRFFRRQNIFEAHKMHLYQRLNQAGFSHSSVTLIYFMTSLMLLCSVLWVDINYIYLILLLVILIGYIIDKKFAIPFN